MKNWAKWDEKSTKIMVSHSGSFIPDSKGLVKSIVFFHLNLIFWIAMGCGIADFGRRGLAAPSGTLTQSMAYGNAYLFSVIPNCLSQIETGSLFPICALVQTGN